MTSIADTVPDIVYVGATVDNNAGKVLQDMRGVMGDEVIFLGPDGLINAAFVQGAGDAAEGAYITFAGYTPDELVRNRRGGCRLRQSDRGDPRSLARRIRGVLLRGDGGRIQAIDKVAEKDRTQDPRRPCSRPKASSASLAGPGVSPTRATRILPSSASAKVEGGTDYLPEDDRRRSITAASLERRASTVGPPFLLVSMVSGKVADQTGA